MGGEIQLFEFTVIVSPHQGMNYGSLQDQSMKFRFMY